MYQPANMPVWQGRKDTEEGPLARRWHEMVSPWQKGAPAGVALLGFACDAGVLRNQGRKGAAEGPRALRQALANLAWHLPHPVYDAGDILCQGDDLEAAQEELANKVSTLLGQQQFPLVLGGGHEVAYGDFLGLLRHAERTTPRPTLGIVNFDAHFDLRAATRATSGTPFSQMAVACEQAKQPFRYLCLGISEAANTQALFARAQALNVRYRRDDEMSFLQQNEISAELERFRNGVDWLYLTVCLDVLPAEVAPGVSAPAARGVELGMIEFLIDVIQKSGKLRLADIAELNPAYDIDNRTAKVAARLAYRLARSRL